MPRGFWSVLFIAVVCGGVAALVALPFTTTEEEPAAVEELPGLVQAPVEVQPLEPTPSPTPTPAPVRRRSVAPAPAPAAPTQEQDQNSIDDLPDGPFDSAKRAVEQEQQQ